MKTIVSLFARHPHSVGESYVGHLITALSFAAKLIVTALQCLVHAIFPFLFTQTASRTIEHLHKEMVTHRNRHRIEEP